MLVPMSCPHLSDDDAAAVDAVLRTPYLSNGPRIEEFERDFAEYVHTPHSVAVSSGTAGLHLAVIAASVDKGDLVITTPFSFVASANCVLYERGIPVFVDIDPVTLNVDPALLAAAAGDLASGRRAARRWLPPTVRASASRRGALRALLPVHVFGQPADMGPICAVAERHGLVVIEDACEAIGAEHEGRKAGTLGDVGVFAFYPNKQMTTGEGGMIVTSREDWAALFRSLRNQGRDVFDEWLEHSRLGYNYRMDEMSAALGLAQLSRIEQLLAKREQVAAWYNQRLGALDGVSIPCLAPTTNRMSWFVYVVRLAPEIDRTMVMTRLSERGVPSRPYFSPIHLQPFYRERFGYEEGCFPVTESVARSTLALPFYGNMGQEQVEYVCEALRESIP